MQIDLLLLCRWKYSIDKTSSIGRLVRQRVTHLLHVQCFSEYLTASLNNFSVPKASHLGSFWKYLHRFCGLSILPCSLLDIHRNMNHVIYVMLNGDVQFYEIGLYCMYVHLRLVVLLNHGLWNPQFWMRISVPFYLTVQSHRSMGLETYRRYYVHLLFKFHNLCLRFSTPVVQVQKRLRLDEWRQPSEKYENCIRISNGNLSGTIICTWFSKIFGSDYPICHHSAIFTSTRPLCKRNESNGILGRIHNQLSCWDNGCSPSNGKGLSLILGWNRYRPRLIEPLCAATILEILHWYQNQTICRLPSLPKGVMGVA